MKKFLALACCLLLLTGCAKTFESDLPQLVNDLLQKQSTMVSTYGTNRTKDYYKYYLPLNMGTRESTQLGEIFIKDESTILMNFDPSSIIIHEYYSGDENETEEQKEEKKQARENGQSLTEENATPTDTATPTESPQIDTETSATTSLTDDNLGKVTMNVDSNKFSYQGTYKNIQGGYYPYTLTIVSMNNQYVVYFNTSIAQFYCISTLAAVQSDINSMFTIAKSITFDTETVLENFSMKKATSSKQQSIDTLQQNLPSVGSIPDLLDQMEQLNGK